MINTGDFPQCRLGSGTETDYGFDTCGNNPVVWGLNSSSQHISLLRIPNPGIQPL
jgi:hypothetical protein